MSYPLPITKHLRTPLRFSMFSSPNGINMDPSVNRSLDFMMDGNQMNNNGNHVTFSENMTSSESNDCEKLIEMLSTVLSSYQTNKISNQDELQGNDPTIKANRNKNDLYIFVRRKGDFQVKNDLYILFY